MGLILEGSPVHDVIGRAAGRPRKAGCTLHNIGTSRTLPLAAIFCPQVFNLVAELFVVASRCTLTSDLKKFVRRNYLCIVAVWEIISLK